jgi:hypothetical protein
VRSLADSGRCTRVRPQVVAALVRRCRELQAALVECAGQLDEAQLKEQGLKEANARWGGERVEGSEGEEKGGGRDAA